MALVVVDLSSAVTRFKILTIVLGLIALVIGAISFYTRLKEETFFVGAVIAAFVISLLNIIVSEGFRKSRMFQVLDFCYHGIAGVILIIAGLVYVKSTLQLLEEGDRIPKSWIRVTAEYYQHYSLRIAASVIAMVEGIAYGVTAVFIKRDAWC